jgi:hypothetical protein
MTQEKKGGNERDMFLQERKDQLQRAAAQAGDRKDFRTAARQFIRTLREHGIVTRDLAQSPEDWYSQLHAHEKLILTRDEALMLRGVRVLRDLNIPQSWVAGLPADTCRMIWDSLTTLYNRAQQICAPAPPAPAPFESSARGPSGSCAPAGSEEEQLAALRGLVPEPIMRITNELVAKHRDRPLDDRVRGQIMTEAAQSLMQTLTIDDARNIMSSLTQTPLLPTLLAQLNQDFQLPKQ